MTTTEIRARLPVDLVKALDATIVAGWLGLEPSGRERHKFPCRWCPSSDALHAYPGPGRGLFCFACGRAFSTIDLTMQARGLGFGDAIRWLADRAGIADAAPILRAKMIRTPAAPPPDPTRTAVYGALVESFPCTDRSLAYLAGRGLAFPATLRECGFFEITDWDVVGRVLLAQFSRDALVVAFPLNAQDTFPLPFHGRPALGIGYQRDRGVTAIRFRNLDPTAPKRHRYRDCHNVPPTIPWHADALHDLDGNDLVVVEGELNAFSLWGLASKLHIIGLPGAGRIPGGVDAPWLRAAGQARRVLCYFDRNLAGDRGAAGFATALATANGWTAAEARTRIQRVRPDVAGDFNELLQGGQLDRLAVEIGAI
jgi:hypothetical protein